MLIKWKKLPYENSTFELIEDAMKCDLYDEELKSYSDRNKMRDMWMPLETKEEKVMLSLKRTTFIRMATSSEVIKLKV